MARCHFTFAVLSRASNMCWESRRCWRFCFRKSPGFRLGFLSVPRMALSAWVKWKIVAGALLLAVLFFGAGFAQAINNVMRTHLGDFVNIVYLMATVWTSLFGIGTERSMPVLQAWVALLVYCALC